MAGPRDAVGSQHAFANGAELRHRGLAAVVAPVDAELDTTDPTVEGTGEHHVLDATIEPGAAQMRSVVGSAYLERLTSFADMDEAGHAGEFVAVEEHEGESVGIIGEDADALVETVGSEIERVDIPDLAVLGAGCLERLAMVFAEQLRSAAVADHWTSQFVIPAFAGATVSGHRDPGPPSRNARCDRCDRSRRSFRRR